MDVQAYLAAIVTVIVLAIAAIVMVPLGLRAFRDAARRRRDDEAALRTLGFTRVEDPAFAARLTSHFSRDPGRGLQVRVVLSRPGPGFVSWASYLGEPAHASPYAVGIQSPQLDLPRFLLLPALSPAQSSAIAASDHRLHELMSPDDPPFRYPPVRLAGTSHTLSGPHVARVEARLDQRVRTWLAQTEGLALSGDGDVLAVWLTWPIEVGWAPVLERNPAQGLALAQAGFEFLRTPGARA